MDRYQVAEKISRDPSRWGVLPILVAVVLSVAGCGEPNLESVWLDRTIVIDGDHTEWEGAVTYFEDADAAIGLRNDGTHLYLCLASTNQNLKTQVLARGFTVWFDSQGGTDRVREIRFPLGAREMGSPMGDPRERLDPDILMASIEETEPEIELISDDGLHTRMFLAQAVGIELDIGLTKGALVYEAKIPLSTAKASVGIGVELGSEIGIGLTTPGIDRQMVREGMERRGPPGGRRGGMRGGMSEPGHRPNMPEPLDMWATVTLAQAADVATGS